MDYIPLNFNILLHPINWLTVFLMLAIAAFALDQLGKLITNHVNNNSEDNQ